MNFNFRLSLLLSRATRARLRECIQKSENVPKRDEHTNNLMLKIARPHDHT